MRSLGVLLILGSIAVADLFPDPELPRIDGKTARISDFAGKKLILIHFASW